MRHGLLHLLRVSLGIAILLIGIIGLVIPVLQGWLLILIAIPIISPEYGRKMAMKLKEWISKYRRPTNP